MPMDFVIEVVKLLTALVGLAAAAVKSLSEARSSVRKRKGRK